MRLLVSLLLLAFTSQAAPQAGYTIDRFSKDVTFHSDGTWVAEQRASVHVDGQSAVRRFGTLSFGFIQDTQRATVLYARVITSSGVTVETPASEAHEVAAALDPAAPVYDGKREMQLPIRGLKPGSTLEYCVRIEQIVADAPGQFWYAQRFIENEPVLRQELTIRVPTGKYVQFSGTPAASVERTSSQVIYRWNSNASAAVHVRLTTFRNWSEVGQWYRSFFPAASPVADAVRKKAAEITAGLGSREEKQKAIYRYVAIQIRYLAVALGTGKYQPQTAEQVLSNQYGDCKDKHVLLTALLAAEGIHAEPAFISFSRTSLDRTFPSPANFDHVISVVGDTWLDTTAEVAPYGMLTLELRGQSALLVHDDGSAALVETPTLSSFAAVQEVTTTAELTTTGSLHARMEIVLRGDDEIPVRNAFHRTPQSGWPDLVQQLVKNFGLSGSVSHVDASSPENLDSAFHLAFDYDEQSLPGWDSLRITAPTVPFIFAVDETDAAPAAIGNIGLPGQFVHRITLRLPSRYMAALPTGIEIETPMATYSSNYSQVHDTVVAERKVIVRQPTVAAADWPTYTAFVQQVKQAEGDVLQLADANESHASELISAAQHSIAAGDFDIAREQLAQAHRLTDKQSELWSAYADLYASTREYRSAVNAQRRVLIMQPESITARLRLSELLLKAGSTSEALETLKFVTSKTNSAAVMNNAAFLLARAKVAPQCAVEYARRAVALQEEEMAGAELRSVNEQQLKNVETLASIWDTLGYALLNAGDPSGTAYLKASWNLSQNHSAKEHLVGAAPPVRSFDVPFSQSSGSADFFLMFDKDGVLDAQFATGEERLKDLARTLVGRQFALALPDSGPERITRRAVAECTSTTCRVTLLLPAAATP